MRGHFVGVRVCGNLWGSIGSLIEPRSSIIAPNWSFYYFYSLFFFYPKFLSILAMFLLISKTARLLLARNRVLAQSKSLCFAHALNFHLITYDTESFLLSPIKSNFIEVRERHIVHIYPVYIIQAFIRNKSMLYDYVDKTIMNRWNVSRNTFVYS